MSDNVAMPSFCVKAPKPIGDLTAGKARIFIYENERQMGLASALSIVSEQTRQVEAKGRTSFIIMAAPSAYAFYKAYVGIAHASQAFQKVLRETHFFQFDDYALPLHHPASFRFLLCNNFFAPLAVYCDAYKVHLFEGDAPDVDAACRKYTELLLEHGPDIQLKGIGENGHWGFHEPGLPLDEEPQFMKVDLSEENVVQQLRDHPMIFKSAGEVPRSAFTANVPLFLKTRELIEDNVPQPSKAFAMLAGYGSEAVDKCVPTSALKTHPKAVVRCTRAAAWALLDYRKRGAVTRDAFARLVELLTGGEPEKKAEFEAYVRNTLKTMQIACEA